MSDLERFVWTEAPPVRPLNDLVVVERDEDWLRTLRWDLTVVRNGEAKIVSTRDELIEAIAPMSVQHFVTLPAARAMPKELVLELLPGDVVKPAEEK